MSNYQENTLATLLNNIVRYKWLLIVPLFLSLTMIYAYTRNIKYYKSSATLSFKTEYFFTQNRNGALSPFESRINLLVSSLKYGEQLDKITAKVWPKIDRETEASKFESLSRKLGSTKGIKLSFRRDNFRALVISYTSQKKEEVYRAVQATIEALLESTKQDTTRRVKKTQDYLTARMANLKSELRSIDQEILRLKNGLAPYVSGESNVALGETFNQESLTPGLDGGLSKALQYHESLPKLQFQLHVAEKELARLKEKHSSGEYKESQNFDSGLPVDFTQDSLYREVQSSLVKKRKDVHLLTSQGFRKAHPKQKSVQAEITNLESLLISRRKELEDAKGSGIMEGKRLEAEQAIRSQISAKTEKVAQINDKIKVLKSYHSEINSNKNLIGSQLDSISAKKSRVEELVQKKYAKTQAFNLAATELEEVQQFGQATADDVGLKITVEEPPYIPNSPVPYAHSSVYAMGIVISLAMGMALIFLIESLDTSIASPAELQVITGVPVLGSVDKFSTETDLQKSRMIRYAALTLLLIFTMIADNIVEHLPL